jgi:hypothetical protein
VSDRFQGLRQITRQGANVGSFTAVNREAYLGKINVIDHEFRNMHLTLQVFEWKIIGCFAGMSIFIKLFSFVLYCRINGWDLGDGAQEFWENCFNFFLRNVVPRAHGDHFPGCIHAVGSRT